MDIRLFYLHFQRMNEKAFADITLATPPTLHYCETEWSWSPALHGDYDFWLVLGGRGQLFADGNPYPLKSGTFILFGPQTRIRATHDPKNRLHVFSVHFILPETAPGIPFTVIDSPDLPLFKIMTRRCASLWNRGDVGGKYQAERILETLLLQFFDEAKSIRLDSIDEQILSLTEEIAAEPGRGWTLEKMARRVHLSRSQFTRRFTALIAQAPMNYVIRARISRARWLLLETRMGIGEIARALGYSDLYYFSRQFRKETGAPPSALRKA